LLEQFSIWHLVARAARVASESKGQGIWISLAGSIRCLPLPRTTMYTSPYSAKETIRACSHNCSRAPPGLACAVQLIVRGVRSRCSSRVGSGCPSLAVAHAFPAQARISPQRTPAYPSIPSSYFVLAQILCRCKVFTLDFSQLGNISPYLEDLSVT
jgi:hypothetical protein